MNIYTIGGYGEVGKNMTAVHIGGDVIIFDIGLYLTPIVEAEERKDIYDEKNLRRIGALPDDTILDSLHLREKVRAILLGHAHLDHIGAVPYASYRYNADIVGTPFTIEVLKTLLRDSNARISNNIRVIHPNSSYIIRGKRDYMAEFINITHSTLQTSLVALHTNEGIVLYANDFKIDNSPVVGKKPNYEAIERIAKKGVKALIVDSLYADDERKTPSEKIARGLLEDVLLTTGNSDAAIVVTTFSSHIARLKSIVDFGKQLGRRVVFVGRSLNKYVSSAIRAGMCPFEKDIILASYKGQVRSILKKANKDRKKYLIVCTGHQGEPGSILDRISRDELPFSFNKNDHLIFSSRTIPTPVNINNRQQIEKRLKQKGIRIFDSVHVSGHAGREDLRDFINMIKPAHIIPAHGDLKKMSAMVELASELGYKLGKNCHLVKDGQTIKL